MRAGAAVTLFHDFIRECDGRLVHAHVHAHVHPGTIIGLPMLAVDVDDPSI